MAEAPDNVRADQSQGGPLLGSWTLPPPDQESRPGGRHLGWFAAGTAAGLAGAATVALWFFIHDLRAGAPLRTPSLLGTALFEGRREPGAAGISLRLAFQYTAVHVAAFVMFGWTTSGLLAIALRDLRVLYLLFMLFCCFEVFFLGAVTVLAEWLLEPLGVWRILGANLLAAAAMLLAFAWMHRSAATSWDIPVGPRLPQRWRARSPW
jgi:hypothetical protein